mmetsp:Transcript_15857/g.33135  ORF Transcript_15857/g.33135 Transcript_15857/m.33135 type:complete len:237 (-) Transcript_15857:383-1093(-)
MGANGRMYRRTAPSSPSSRSRPFRSAVAPRHLSLVAFTAPPPHRRPLQNKAGGGRARHDTARRRRLDAYMRRPLLPPPPRLPLASNDTVCTSPPPWGTGAENDGRAGAENEGRAGAEPDGSEGADGAENVGDGTLLTSGRPTLPAASWPRPPKSTTGIRRGMLTDPSFTTPWASSARQMAAMPVQRVAGALMAPDSGPRRSGAGSMRSGRTRLYRIGFCTSLRTPSFSMTGRRASS